jgi:G3E family GTPase
MVTVVDALSFFDNFSTADFLSDRQQPGEVVDEQDERNISDLLTDQLEFANVLILNKCDLISSEQLDRTVSLLRALNPAAEILTSVRSKIDLSKILNTKRFSFEDAVLSAGWLKSLREEVKPETEEYGIGVRFPSIHPYLSSISSHSLHDPFPSYTHRVLPLCGAQCHIVHYRRPQLTFPSFSFRPSILP